jgi:hypothetical protein
MANNRAYTFDPKMRGGFGGARFTIVMDDGTVVCEDRAGLWDAGRVPWWLDEVLVPNCTIVSGSGHDLVPGYTSPSGRPLPFTGGPVPTA